MRLHGELLTLTWWMTFNKPVRYLLHAHSFSARFFHYFVCETFTLEMSGCIKCEDGHLYADHRYDCCRCDYHHCDWCVRRMNAGDHRAYLLALAVIPVA